MTPERAQAPGVIWPAPRFIEIRFCLLRRRFEAILNTDTLEILMKTIRAYIDSKQQEFRNHPFFDVLEQMGSLKEIGCIVPGLTFWVMAFQDVLRLNEERVTDPDLKKIARHHRLEDAGHEQWFLHDRNYMCGMDSNSADLNALFGKDARWARDPAYAIMAEVFKSDSDWLNIVLLLVIESSGHVFFEKIVKQVQAIGEDRNLKYFSSSHFKVELAHALFDDEMERKLYAEPLPENIREDALRLVDRCYGAFDQMFDGLMLACDSQGVTQ